MNARLLRVRSIAAVITQAGHYGLVLLAVHILLGRVSHVVVWQRLSVPGSRSLGRVVAGE